MSGRTAVRDDEAVVVDPPLEGARWVVGNGCCAAATAHRNAVLPVNGAFHVAERFAIDFVRLDAERRLFDGPVGDLASYGYYGERVLSVADGVVVGTQDGLPEQTPPNFPTDATAQTAGGNHVVVDIGDGRFAFYAHLQPGSLRVAVGDRVERGQVLGRLGNSGNSDAPHLHFHVMDGPSPLGSNGLPFVFRSFASAGTVTDENALFVGEPAPIGPALAGRHREQLPLNLQVVRFFPRRRA